jgi:hypothetical protein
MQQQGESKSDAADFLGVSDLLRAFWNGPEAMPWSHLIWPVLLSMNVASRSWAIPQKRGSHSETGEPFVWTFSVMPVFTFFFVIDVFWGALILVSPQWRRGYLWLLTALIWLVAAVIDFAHH